MVVETSAMDHRIIVFVKRSPNMENRIMDSDLQTCNIIRNRMIGCGEVRIALC